MPIVLRRHGPLTALGAAEGDESALAVGDVAVRHVRLTVRGVAPFLGDAPAGFMPWTDVRAIDLDPPTTWWPNPAIGDVVVPLLEGVFGGGGAMAGDDGVAAETPSFPVRVRGIGDQATEWPATVHFLSGYRKKDARATVTLLGYFVSQPDARTLLGQPAQLLDRLSEIVRGAPRIT